LVALHIERLFRRVSCKSSPSPLRFEETGNGSTEKVPEMHVIGLEHHPLQGNQQSVFDHEEEATYVDELPTGEIAEGPRAVNAQTAARKGTETIDVDRVQEPLHLR